MRKYSGAVAARPRAGFGRFGRVISRGGPNLVLTRVVTAPNDPPRYVIDKKVVYNILVIEKYISYIKGVLSITLKDLEDRLTD